MALNGDLPERYAPAHNLLIAADNFFSACLASHPLVPSGEQEEKEQEVHAARRVLERALSEAESTSTGHDEIDEWSWNARSVIQEYRPEWKRAKGSEPLLQMIEFIRYGERLFATLEQEGEPDAIARPAEFTQLSRFPVTTEGHVAFLESLSSKLRDAALAGSSGQHRIGTVRRMLRLKDWEEARRRMQVPGLTGAAADAVRNILLYPLDHTNVQHVARRLTTAVENLRDAFQATCAESGRANSALIRPLADDLARLDGTSTLSGPPMGKEKSKPGVIGRNDSEKGNDAAILRLREGDPRGDLNALAERCGREGLLKVEANQSPHRAIKLALQRARNDRYLVRKSRNAKSARRAQSRKNRRA